MVVRRIKFTKRRKFQNKKYSIIISGECKNSMALEKHIPCFKKLATLLIFLRRTFTPHFFGSRSLPTNKLPQMTPRGLKDGEHDRKNNECRHAAHEEKHGRL